MIYRTDLILGEAFGMFSLLSFPRFWTFCIHWFAFLFSDDVTVKTQNITVSSEKIFPVNIYGLI